VDKRLGHYQIVRMLGSGGMGQVYEAVHDQMKRRAAIKILHKRFAHNRQIATRFLNEAKATSMAEHPGIVHIYEFGTTDEGTAFIVMEYLSGDTLRQRLDGHGGKLPPEVVMRIGRQMASALHAAHEKGIVHRDLKPVNIMVVRDPETTGGERAKILDFGLAKIIEPEGGEGITNTGTILGTPAYMAPEQCKSARAADPKSDVYSLGVILYEMLSGEIPFDADTDAELLSKHMFSDPPPLLSKAPQTGMALAALVHRMLDKDSVSRPSAGAVASELAQLYGSASLSTSATNDVVAAPVSDGPSRRNVVRDAAARPGEAVPHEIATPEPTAPTAQVAAMASDGGQPGRKLLWFFLSLFLCGTGGAVAWQLKGHELYASLLRKPPIRWSIASIPAEAEVLDENGKSLGKTPLSVERPHGTGTVSLTLRLDGYLDKPLPLPLSVDTAITEKLEPLPTNVPPTPSPAITRDGGQSADLAEASSRTDL
jgi:serine/threonine protein kinase